MIGAKEGPISHYNWARMVDEPELDRLAIAAAAHDEEAWQALWVRIEEPLARIVAQPQFLGRLGQREDDRRNIIVAVMARLRAHDFHRLQLYIASKRDNPRLRFLTWLRVVAKRVGIDYMRAHPDYVRGRDGWIDPVSLPPGSQLFGERPPITTRETARELLEFSAAAMPDDQRRALELWSRGDGFDDIARTLGLADAEKTVRAAIERLRRRFRSKEHG